MRAGLKDHRTFEIAVAATVALTLLLAVGAWAYDSSQKDQIAPGVTIGGVQVGGRSEDNARRLVERKVVAPLARPVTVNFDGKSYRLTADQLDQHADVQGMLDDAVGASRDGGILTRLGRYVTGDEVAKNIPAQVTYSHRAVDDFVKKLADDIDRDPVDATVMPSGDRLDKVPGENGLALRTGVMVSKITRLIEDPAGDRTVHARVRRTYPDVTTKELAKVYPRYLTLDRATYTLRFFSHLKLVKSYTVAVGQAGLETPAGIYHIQDKQVDPSWHVPNSAWAGDLAGQIIPPGPDDPLKARWMGIFNGAGIHGTDETWSLGHAVSHGCVRMSIPDVIDLYDRVEVGDPIYIG